MNRENIEAAKDAISLIELAEEQGVEFKGQPDGDRAYCKCPFHEDSSASMALSERYAVCFAGGCGWSGDIIDWMSEKEGWDFKTALRWACERANITFEQPTAKEIQRIEIAQKQTGWIAMVEAASNLYVDEMEDSEGHRYARGRGISEEVIERFSVGYCPRDHETLSMLDDAGFGIGDIRESKLVVGKKIDRPRFADKLVIPVKWHGRVINLYGRDITGSDNMPHDYLLRHKMCFGWDEAKKDKRVIKSKTIFAAEALIDALVSWSAGVPCCAMYGTKAMRISWAARMKRAGIERVVWLTDGDTDGRKAALAVGAIFMAVGIKFYIADTPDNEDPASIGSRSYKELRTLAKGAVSNEMTAYEFADHYDLIDEKTPPLIRKSGEDLCLDCSGYEIVIHNWRMLRDGVKIVGTICCNGRAMHRDGLNTWASRSRQMFVKNSGLTGVEAESAKRRLMLIGDELERWQKMGPRHDVEESEDGDVEIDNALMSRAQEFLEDPDLLEHISRDITKMGYVGETKAKLLMYLIATGRLMKDPLHACVMSQSSSGKSALTKAVVKLMPIDSVFEMSAMSSRAMYHLEPGALKHRWVLMAERSGYDEIADHAVRLLQSEGHLKYAVAMKDEETGQIETIEKIIEGPMAWTETTTDQENDLNPENLNRMIVIYLDESNEQTERVLEYQREMMTEVSVQIGVDRQKLSDLHRAAQSMLKPNLHVIIPFAEAVRFPTQFVRARRDLQKVLNIVAASAVLHQFQRRQGIVEGQDVVYANAFDYKVAYGLYSLLLRQAYAGLPKKSEELLKIICSEIGKISKSRNDLDPTSIVFRKRDITAWSEWPLRVVTKALEALEEQEIIEAKYDGGRGNPASYTLTTTSGDMIGAAKIAGMTSPSEIFRIDGPNKKVAKKKTKKKTSKKISKKKVSKKVTKKVGTR